MTMGTTMVTRSRPTTMAITVTRPLLPWVMRRVLIGVIGDIIGRLIDPTPLVGLIDPTLTERGSAVTAPGWATPATATSDSAARMEWQEVACIRAGIGDAGRKKKPDLQFAAGRSS